jgi:DinB family
MKGKINIWLALALLIVGVLMAWSLKKVPLPPANAVQVANAASLRSELRSAWQRSQAFTRQIVEQMPPAYFSYKYTDDAMTFAEQWRHCCIYTCGQLASNLDLTDNPYGNVLERPPVDIDKTRVLAELDKTYRYVDSVITHLPTEKLYAEVDFAKDRIPAWRLFYAMENHIIHHRGQCVVYLRMKGVKPIGYYGW